MRSIQVLIIGLIVAFATLANVAMNIVMPASAYANPIVTTSAESFLEAAAIEAGIPSADMVATVAGIFLTTKGMSIANEEGVRIGNSLDKNLENLLEAADYPDYETLSDEDRTAWGSKANYDAAKLNSLLDAFGLANDKDRYYSSQGNNFEFSNDVKDQLHRLGRIGNNWITGIGNKVSEIKGLITDETVFNDYFPVQSGTEIDTSNDSNWPGSWPNINEISIGNKYWFKYQDQNLIRIWVSSIDVQWLFVHKDGTSLQFLAFSKNNFQYGINVGNPNSSDTNVTSSNARKCTYNGEEFYIAYSSQSVKDIVNSNIQYNIWSSGQGTKFNSSYLTEMTKAAYVYLYGNVNNNNAGSVIDGFPGENEIPDDERVYIPSDGVNNSNTWNTYLTPTTINRPTNNYNPGKETETPEWRDETTANVIPLFDVHFDKLFPFCLLFDIRDLFEKVKTVTDGESESGNYLQVSIPMKVGTFIDESIDLDLAPVYNLLIMVRPFVQILLAAGLLFVTVRFWQGILTG